MLPLLRGQRGVDLRVVLDRLDDPFQQSVQVFQSRERVIDDCNLLLQLGGKFEHGRQDDQCLVARLQGVGQIAQPAGYFRVADEGVEVLQEEDRGIVRIHHRVEGGAGLAGALIRGGRRVDEPLGDGPDEQPFRPLPGDGAQRVLHPLLLPGDDVKQWIARADKCLEFLIDG